MANPNKQPHKNHLSRTAKKGLATVALAGTLAPVYGPNVARVWSNGNVPAPRHRTEGIQGGSKVAEPNRLHSATFKLGPHEVIWDIAERVHEQNGQDIREVSDYIQSYLPGPDHSVQPSQRISVLENEQGEIVPNPNPENSAGS